nr:immunoglobulin heavy chain junction region [Macaca mulatta]MOX58660.1 immunoglobulin heavy chain junction region [Macaca mulatta]MOX58784.1 immunoglobulin heavy chain junction region [Macaca mulatta]MOX58802.1 immunoglobulin heavy chain junction region [Macaca mulatta]MOX59270.1 immunoglobulin heavy chain junction region [Macaca mulatta]
CGRDDNGVLIDYW